jgi:CRP-like cAMP-binding protein
MIYPANCALCNINSKCIISHAIVHAPSSVKHVVLSKKTIIYSEGLPADNVFILKSGSVSMTLSNRRGALRIADFIQAGEIFGLDAFLEDKTRVFTAITREDTSICTLPCFEFQRVLTHDHDRLWAIMLSLASQTFRHQLEKVEISGDPVSRRLQSAFFRISKANLSTRIKQSELSQYLGVSEETVSRNLRALRRKRAGFANQ